ncbi:Ribosomal RNA processing Brix domain protein [Zea mays]|uniref:Ribosomal RNA processing Brix domain protein n=1 Tax=Zea mays TaxID=4577 RepID=A0A1D6Q9V4_MAIZE|nr:Ribosomal RNA processing Brix domain protein [Zea mays]
MNSRKLWNMQRIGISPHLLLSTQIEGSLMLYLSWGCLMAYCTFQTIQTCSSEGHKGLQFKKFLNGLSSYDSA